MIAARPRSRWLSLADPRLDDLRHLPGVGLLFQANAGMQHALGEGARYATLCTPRHAMHVADDDQIKARMTSKLFGKGTARSPVPTRHRDRAIAISRSPTRRR